MSLLHEFLLGDFSNEYKENVVQLLLSQNMTSPIEKHFEEKYFTHKVRSGEILYTLAKRYGCKMNKIAELNPQISGKLRIEAGMELKIPASA